MRGFAQRSICHFLSVFPSNGAMAEQYCGIAAIGKAREERQRALRTNMETKAAFGKGSFAIREKRNGGHPVVGAKAPGGCPVYQHPQTDLVVRKENSRSLRRSRFDPPKAKESPRQWTYG